MKTLTLIALTAALVLTPAARAASPACVGWTQVTSPNMGHGDNVLTSVAANSSSDIWAVGQIVPDTDPNITNTLTQHYDGTAWSMVPSPNVGTKANALLSVTATGGLAWAVGYYFDSMRSPRSLIEAWNGTAWTVVTHPDPGTEDWLFGVSANSPTDIWAVGAQKVNTGPFQTLIEHFDGARWSVIPSPSPGTTGNQLFGVHAISSQSVWAVGQQFGDAGPDQALTEHWDGTRWSVVPAATSGDHSLLAYGVSAVSDASVWFAGDAQDNVQNPVTLAEQYLNSQWTLRNSANIGTGENHFLGIAALSNDVVFSVGGAAPVTAAGINTLVERHDSSGWFEEPSPSPGQANAGNSELAGITIISPADIWAVGAYDGRNASQTLILHRCQ